MNIYQVDAFADRIFSGNPAGVCIMDSMPDESLMQNIAAEMNASETAFLTRNGNGFDLRWFTPAREVDLCGHATLASAHILWETGILAGKDTARFHTKSGVLSASKRGDSIELDFPREEAKTTAPPVGLLETLKVDAKFVGRNRMDYLVEVESEELVWNLDPDFELLKKIDTRGIIVTAKSDDPGNDFVSRFFVPAYGINEDPVTGSSHCCLGPYWEAKLKKSELSAYQASARGGFLKVRVDKERVFLGGKAVTVFIADFRI